MLVRVNCYLHTLILSKFEDKNRQLRNKNCKAIKRAVCAAECFYHNALNITHGTLLQSFLKNCCHIFTTLSTNQTKFSFDLG